MSLIDGLKPGDRIRVTVKDPDSDDTETLDATVIIPAFDSLVVRPDDTLMGLSEMLIIEPHTLIALEKITSDSASSSPAQPPSD